MKKSELRKIIKEEILKENPPGFDVRKSGEALPTLDSVKAVYEVQTHILSQFSYKGRTDLEGMKLYIEDKYPNDQDLKHIYNDLLRSVQSNSQVDSWQWIEPIK